MDGLVVACRQDAPIPLDARFSCGPRETLALVGPSGAGKTTLLRAIAGLARVADCAVSVGGEAWSDPARGIDLPAHRRAAGFVFQSYALFPHMTALGNVMEGPRIVRRMPAAEARGRALAELARVGLADKADAYPAHLSGGQKQRVAIARALAMDPEILLFDEPTSSLDPELVGEVLGTIQSLAREGRTMRLVTHELGFAYHVATRVLFLADGRILEQGTPDEVLKAPRMERTRAFIARHQEFRL
jgi:polar amino acid transport system ATP-binding protein